MFRTILMSSALLVALTGMAAAETLSGPFTVQDGQTIRIGGRTVKLADIAVPALGDKCIWKGQTLDCGVLARAGLMDITAGATVFCKATTGGHRCMAGDYDLGFGLIHSGWAVALGSAPSHYHKRMQQARTKKRALWEATDLDGNPEYALKIKR